MSFAFDGFNNSNRDKFKELCAVFVNQEMSISFRNMGPHEIAGPVHGYILVGAFQENQEDIIKTLPKGGDPWTRRAIFFDSTEFFRVFFEQGSGARVTTVRVTVDSGDADARPAWIKLRIWLVKSDRSLADNTGHSGFVRLVLVPETRIWQDPNILMATDRDRMLVQGPFLEESDEEKVNYGVRMKAIHQERLDAQDVVTTVLTRVARHRGQTNGSKVYPIFIGPSVA
jgi:hypothetical protein